MSWSYERSSRGRGTSLGARINCANRAGTSRARSPENRSWPFVARIMFNFMINWYDGAMDTNLVIPRGVDQTEVIFDFYFPDISESAQERNRASIEVSRRIQDEDVAICKSVQHGLNSRAYQAGRLSVRRETREHLFHWLLYADLKAEMDADMRI